ncbi:MAG: hypothetical protein WCG25_08540 [bacterium]
MIISIHFSFISLSVCSKSVILNLLILYSFFNSIHVFLSRVHNNFVFERASLNSSWFTIFHRFIIHHNKFNFSGKNVSNVIIKLSICFRFSGCINSNSSRLISLFFQRIAKNIFVVMY